MLKLFNIETGEELRTFTGHTNFVNSITFSRDGKYALSGSRDSTLKLWDIETGKELRTFTGHTGTVWSVCISPDGRYALSGSIDSTLKLWDIETGKELRTFTGHTGEVWSVCISPDGRYALSGSRDKTLKLWDIETGKELRTFIGHTGVVWLVCISPDGRYALSGSWDNTLKLWDIETGKELMTFVGHIGAVSSVSFSPSGIYALSGSFDNTLILWNIEYLFKFRNDLRTFEGHTGIIKSVSFSPDGKYALSGSADNTLKLWDIEKGKELVTLILLDSNDWVAVTPSGLFDASPGAEKLIYYVAGNKIIELNQLKARYYQPGLLKILMGKSKEELREVPPNDFVRLYPEVKIFPIDNKNSQLRLRLSNQGGGIGSVSIYIDNILLLDDARSSVSDSSKEELNLKIDLIQEKFQKFYKYNEENIIKVVVHNAEEYLSSRGDTFHFTPKSNSINKYCIHFYGLFAGVSNYKGDDIDLLYASDDAKDFGNAISAGAKNLYGDKNVSIQLLNDDQTLKELQPTKTNIYNTFVKMQEALPQDIVVIYLSGHGITWGGQDGDFYYLTKDASTLNISNLNDTYMRNNTISSLELADWINLIPARKKVLIMDACNSGRGAEQIFATLTKDVPASQIRALDRAQERAGFYILSGCAADQFSYESSIYGQGILTYSLLKAIKGASLRVDGEQEYIDIGMMLSYSVDEVPKLALGISGIQQPFFRSPDQIKSFDIGRIEQKDKERIKISEPKPVFIASNFLESNQLSDVLNLSDKINGQLDEITAKGKGAELIFTRAKDYPDAYQISGLYQISNSKIICEFKIRKDQKDIGDRISLEENLNDTSILINKIVEMVKKQLQKVELDDSFIK